MAHQGAKYKAPSEFYDEGHAAFTAGQKGSPYLGEAKLYWDMGYYDAKAESEAEEQEPPHWEGEIEIAREDDL